MTLFLPHDPPRAFCASPKMMAGPPPAGIFFNFELAKNATNLPSGDQKGNAAPSVPSSRTAVAEFNDRIQILADSFSLRATNAAWLESGEIAGGPEKSPVKSNRLSVGAGILA